MLRSIDELRGYELQANDGPIGRCKDFLFEDAAWVVRYMVADTRKWLPGRKVLVSPIALGQPNWIERRFPVALTKDELKQSPPLEEDEPVSKRYETAWARYYGWPYYWVGGGLWGATDLPATLYAARLSPDMSPEPTGAERPSEAERDQADTQSELRSEKEVKGYHIQATDGEIGHVEDMVVEDNCWAIRYVVVDTRNLLPGGQKVLISPGWIEDVDWASRSLAVNLTRQQVKDSPPFDPRAPVNRAYEERLYDFYGRPRYWT